jgi:uncharacterized protein (TIGR02246 family)
MCRYHLVIFCAVLLGLIGGCAKQTVPDTRAEDERMIRELENEGWKTIEAKDLEGLMSFIAEDAVGLYSNTPILTGKDAIRESWKTSFARSGFALSGEPVKVEVSRGGDLAYVQGTYSLTVNDAAGKPIPDQGKYIVIYKKQADGNWRIVVDIPNSDLPVAVSQAQ